MNAEPEFEYTNCCQPRHAVAFAAPLQAGTLLLLFVKKFVLSWSEKVLATGGGFPPTFPLSLVTATLSKEPIAVDMNPLGAWAETSLPLPTISGRGPLRGREASFLRQ